MVRQCGDGGSDLGCIGRDSGDHPEQGFGEPQAFTDPFEARDQYPAGSQAHDSPNDKGEEGKPYGHRSVPPRRRAASVRASRRKPRGWTQVTSSSAACAANMPTRLPGSPLASVPFRRLSDLSKATGFSQKVRTVRSDLQGPLKGM